MKTAEQAWVVKEWISGRLLASIAADFGCCDAVACTAIKRFCDDWADVDVMQLQLYGPARKQAALKALQNYFLRTGGAVLFPTSTYPKVKEVDREIHYYDYGLARCEHVWLLRAEGLTFQAITVRMGLSLSQVRQMSNRFVLRMQRAMRRTRVVVVGTKPPVKRYRSKTLMLLP